MEKLIWEYKNGSFIATPFGMFTIGVKHDPAKGLFVITFYCKEIKRWTATCDTSTQAKLYAEQILRNRIAMWTDIMEVHPGEQIQLNVFNVKPL